MSSVQTEIFEWVKGLPAWQQDLFVRATSSHPLPGSELDDVLALLLGEREEAPMQPRVVPTEAVPNADEGQALLLISVGPLSNVNALATDQVLEPGTHLTVVYGDNGAGKTGYSRVLRYGGRGMPPGSLRANVYEPDAGSPCAEVAVQVGAGEVTTLSVDCAQPAPPLLARVSVFDAEAGEDYLTRETEVVYVPTALRSLQRLAVEQRELQDLIAARLRALPDTRIDTTGIAVGTKARATVDSLSADSDLQAVRDLARLTSEEQQRSDELATTLAAAPDAAAAAHQVATVEHSLKRQQALRAALTQTAGSLSAGALERIRGQAREVSTATAAVSDIARAAFDKSVISGVGGESWKAMWRAAERFFEEEGHIHTGEVPREHCPLCQQQLDDAARSRFEGFAEFVRGSAEEARAAAAQALQASLDGLPSSSALLIGHEAALAELAPEDGARLADWIAGLARCVTEVRAEPAASPGPALSAPPLDPVESLISDLEIRLADLQALTTDETRGALVKQKTELDARVALEQQLPFIEQRIYESAERARLEAANRSLDTRGVSRKLTDFSQAFVTSEFAAALRDQLRGLRFGKDVIEVEVRTREGRPGMSLAIKSVQKAPLQDVLSEGERRRLALAVFLAELKVGKGRDPVVLDDPVCSVDHQGRRAIAHALVGLSARRQTIVFTHDLVFLNELTIAAGEAVKHVHVCRVADVPGHLSAHLPWQGQNTGQRINTLRERLRDLQSDTEPNQYARQARLVCEELREAVERFIEREVFYGVVDRFAPGVKTDRLPEIVADRDIIDRTHALWGDASRWTHDESAAVNAEPPTFEEIASAITELQQLLSETKRRRKIQKERPGAAEAAA